MASRRWLRFLKWWLIIDYWWIASRTGLRFMDLICATPFWIYEFGFMICEWLPEGDIVLQIWFRLLKVMIDYWWMASRTGVCLTDLICATRTWIYEFGFMICEWLPEKDYALTLCWKSPSGARYNSRGWNPRWFPQRNKKPCRGDITFSRMLKKHITPPGFCVHFALSSVGCTHGY